MPPRWLPWTVLLGGAALLGGAVWRLLRKPPLVVQAEESDASEQLQPQPCTPPDTPPLDAPAEALPNSLDAPAPPPPFPRPRDTRCWLSGLPDEMMLAIFDYVDQESLAVLIVSCNLICSTSMSSLVVSSAQGRLVTEGGGAEENEDLEGWKPSHWLKLVLNSERRRGVATRLEETDCNKSRFALALHAATEGDTALLLQAIGPRSASVSPLIKVDMKHISHLLAVTITHGKVDSVQCMLSAHFIDAATNNKVLRMPLTSSQQPMHAYIPPCVRAASIPGGHIPILRLLCAAGADVNEVSQQGGASPLMICAAQGDTALDSTRVLLDELSANVHACTPDMRTLLHFAAVGGDGPTVDLIMRHAQKGTGQGEEGAAGMTVLDVEVQETTLRRTALFIAVEQGQAGIGAADRLLEHGANPNVSDSDGRTALMAAVGQSARGSNTPLNPCPDAVRLLLENGADPDAPRMSDGATALYVASLNGSLKSPSLCIVDLLIQGGADVHTTRRTDGSSSLDMALAKGHSQAVELILQAAATSVTCQGHQQPASEHRLPLQNPLLVAAQNPDSGADMLKALLAHASYDDWLHCPKYCVTAHFDPLCTACAQKNPDAALILLTAGAPPNSMFCSKDITTPLLASIEARNSKLTLRLLEAGADVNRCDSHGINPLMACAIHSSSHPALMRTLVKDYGADVDVSDTKYSQTVLHCLLRLADPPPPAMVQLLLDSVVESIVTRLDVFHRPALWYAVQREHYSLAKLLLSRGMHHLIDVKDVDGVNCLYLACITGNEKILGLLLAAGSDPLSSHLSDGTSPLAAAASAGHVKVVKRLMRLGCSPLTRSSGANGGRGETALIAAAANGHLSVCRVLLSPRCWPAFSSLYDPGGSALELALEVCDCQGKTALQRATQNGHYACSAWLRKLTEAASEDE